MEAISVEIIKAVIDRLFEKLQKNNIKEIPFSDNFYWDISPEGAANMSAAPELEAGSLKDDIGFLVSLIQEGYDTDYLELERLSSIFKMMSIRLSRQSEY